MYGLEILDMVIPLISAVVVAIISTGSKKSQVKIEELLENDRQLKAIKADDEKALANTVQEMNKMLESINERTKCIDKIRDMTSDNMKFSYALARGITEIGEAVAAQTDNMHATKLKNELDKINSEQIRLVDKHTQV